MHVCMRLCKHARTLTGFLQGSTEWVSLGASPGRMEVPGRGCQSVCLRADGKCMLCLVAGEWHMDLVSCWHLRCRHTSIMLNACEHLANALAFHEHECIPLSLSMPWSFFRTKHAEVDLGEMVDPLNASLCLYQCMIHFLDTKQNVCRT
jgi:hypothetical protein